MKTKEIKFGVRTERHDLDVKIKAIRKFLDAGDRVHVVVQMRGREQAHPEVAQTMMANVLAILGPQAKVMTPSRHEGRIVHLTLTPGKSGGASRP